MRLIGWIFLVSGIWSLWKALADREALGLGGVLMVAIGLVLLSPRGRALVAWIGGGLLTGLCLFGGVGLLGVGVLALLVHGELLSAGLGFPVRSLVIPLLLLGSGLFLLLVAVDRLLREYRT